MTKEIIVLVVAIGACGVLALIRQLRKCADEINEAMEESENESLSELAAGESPMTEGLK